ncbi:MAG: methyl-accepting chemotaxis protein, partial [Ignavibacteria bacterium]
VAAVDEMSSSLKEQARANGENAQKVEGIARLSEDNATAFSQTAQTIRHLDELAHGLQATVGHFRS